MRMRRFLFPVRRGANFGDAPVGRRRGFKVWPLLAFGVFFLFYYFGNQQEVPITGRKQLVAVSEEQMLPLGLNSYRDILSKSQVVETGPAVDMVRGIAERIIKVVERPDLKWEVNLIASDQANAFALPGGKVAVYTGILPIATNEDGLAAIIGHEIAHIIARHGAERMSHQQLVQFGSMALSMSVGDMDYETQKMVLGALGLGAQYGFILPFSRKHESEADKIGLIYLAKACFNPEEAPRLWERMAQASEKQVPEFSSTHPAPETRIEQLKSWLPEAMQVRSEFCKS